MVIVEDASVHSHSSMENVAVGGGLEPYAKALFDEVMTAVPAWLERSIGALLATPVESLDPSVRERIDSVVQRTRDDIARDLSRLLATDVDEQRTSPMHVLRRSTGGVTRLLSEMGVPPVLRDEFDASVMPDDPFALGPLTWKDLSEEVHDAGITWGAWKAATVLQRRRSEGKA